MGVTIFMFGFFAVAIGSSILCIAAIVQLCRGSAQEKKRGKWMLTIGVIPFLATVLLVLFFRIVNLEGSERCKTNILVEGGYWVDHMTIQGVEYQVFELGECEDLQLGDAVASWRKDISLLDWIFGHISEGNYYTVENAEKFDLLATGVNGRLFCSEADYEQAQMWYSTPGNYEWFIKTDSSETATPFSELSRDAANALLEVEKTYDSDADTIVEIQVPHNTSLVTVGLFSRSHDGVLIKESVILDCHEGKLYVCNAFSSVEGGTIYYCQPIPEWVEELILVKLNEVQKTGASTK